MVLGLCAAAGMGCKAKVPAITTPFADSFERVQLGFDWNNTGAEYRISGGRLNVSHAYNHPLWLRKRLPRDVRTDLDAWSNEARGDLKIELFGDGHSYDPDGGRYVINCWGVGYRLIDAPEED